MSEEVKLERGVNYESVNFGPFVMGVKMPDHVIEGLLERGRKLNDPANKVLAGHIKNEHHYTIEDRDPVTGMYYKKKWTDKTINSRIIL